MSEICCSVRRCTGLDGWTTTAIASRATTNSTGEMSFSSAALISSGFILREALAMFTVPLIMAAMPVPDPPPVTEMRTSGCNCMYSSAQASARLTSVSEPLFSMVPAAALSDEVGCCAPQPTSSQTRPNSSALSTRCLVEPETASGSVGKRLRRLERNTATAFVSPH